MWDKPPLVPDLRDTALAKPPAELDQAWSEEPGRYDQEYAQHWRKNPWRAMQLPYYGFERVDLAIEHGDQVDGHYTGWLAEHHPNPDGLRGPENALLSPNIVCPQAWRTRMPEELYPTSYVAAKTIERLEEFARFRDWPFLLKCSFPDPHHPFDCPEPWSRLLGRRNSSRPRRCLPCWRRQRPSVAAVGARDRLPESRSSALASNGAFRCCHRWCRPHRTRLRHRASQARPLPGPVR